MGLLREAGPPFAMAEGHHHLAEEAARAIALRPSAPLIFLCGDDEDGQEDVAARAAQMSGLALFILRADDLPPPGPDLTQIMLLWERESRLLPAALLLCCPPGVLSPPARLLAEILPAPLFLGCRDALAVARPCLRLQVVRPPPAEQAFLWRQALGPASARFAAELEEIAAQFRLSARSIARSGAAAAQMPGQMAADLWDACRALARPRLEDLAQRIVPAATSPDLVLPEPQMQMLHQLAAQVRHRLRVYEDWGFAALGRRGLGVTALFCGASGTGKTLAAEVLAHELRLDLYRIDTSAVVSKYIGETPKHLKQVFDAAEAGGVLLLFDEADALFGKRSEVKDSHDRYANIEVGYLLQRLESFQGLAILTTNLKSSLDRAFMRRLRFVVNFPFPDAPQREAIWGRMFSPTAPISHLDSRRLAQLNVAGGNIRNIALNAAFLAAAAGESISMPHLLQAARQEVEKIERPLVDAETRGWA
jgi:hypothetical protein